MSARPSRADLERIERLAALLDSRYRVPGTSIRFGLDSVVGLVPGVGDTLVVLPSVWMIAQGIRFGAPRRTIARMAVNTAADYVLGLIPLVGDLADLGFKSNLKNAALIRDALESLPQGPESGEATTLDLQTAQGPTGGGVAQIGSQSSVSRGGS